ncbi:MAG: DNA replication/repair protein RecF [Christensenella sp.]|nr:DNA replication/repair protein RecF [Christensenella sp.]
MNIKEIKLINFRNYKEETIVLNEGLNVIVGKNAMGKTNLLESIYCCGIGKSTKTNKYKELIKWGEKYSYIKITLSKKYRNHIIEFSIDDQDKKRVKVDGIPLLKISDLLGILNIVFFSPDEMKLIKESPQERRRFMDISLSQQFKDYLFSLNKYNEVLAQRNKLLKENFKNENIKDMLSIWDFQLIDYGTKIIKYRYEFIERIKKYANDVHLVLSDNLENLVLEYDSFIKYEDDNQMKINYQNKINENIDKDINLQYTNYGPHRDDIKIFVNNIDIRKFGSQGQQRTASLSLKLAEISLFKTEIGETPVLLLDDVLSELDESRRNKLIHISSNLQTIITCTDFDSDIKYNRIEIENGRVKNSNK